MPAARRCGADDLAREAKFWQTEPGFDTIDIQAQGSALWVAYFPELCEQSGACQLSP
jgi:hypothetical protein